MGRLAPGIVGARTWRGHRRKRTERMHQDHGGHDPFQRHGPHGRVKKGGGLHLDRRPTCGGGDVCVGPRGKRVGMPATRRGRRCC